MLNLMVLTVGDGKDDQIILGKLPCRPLVFVYLRSSTGQIVIEPRRTQTLLARATCLTGVAPDFPMPPP